MMHGRKCRIDELTSCSNMSRVSVLLYSVSLNNKMKQWAFTLLDLVVAKVLAL